MPSLCAINRNHFQIPLQENWLFLKIRGAMEVMKEAFLVSPYRRLTFFGEMLSWCKEWCLRHRFVPGEKYRLYVWMNLVTEILFIVFFLNHQWLSIKQKSVNHGLFHVRWVINYLVCLDWKEFLTLFADIIADIYFFSLDRGSNALPL